jgi:DNA-3-methyladenine glycosylase
MGSALLTSTCSSRTSNQISDLKNPLSSSPSRAVSVTMVDMKRIGRAFFEQDTATLAKAVLGKRLVTRMRGVMTAGMIVEVEAYLGSNDPACHAARGMTKRNEVMFRAPGHCYVYLIYGMYHCVNIVSDPVGIGSAVLIRAVEPLSGFEAMQRRRKQRILKPRELARGPGRLCQAMGISIPLSGESFITSERIWLEAHEDIPSEEIAASGRIGITQGTELPLRFYLPNNPWVSGSRLP